MNATEQIKAVKRAATAFLVAWKGGNHYAMHQACTHTYISNYPTKAEIKQRFPKRIKSYRVVLAKMANPSMCDVVYYIKYQGEDLKMYMRLVCETAPYIPSSAGDWRVNPISIRQVVKEKAA